MTDDEIVFIKEKVIELLSQNKKGLSIDTIIDYLDYVNKWSYSAEELTPILGELISNEKIKMEDDVYFPI